MIQPQVLPIALVSHKRFRIALEFSSRESMIDAGILPGLAYLTAMAAATLPLALFKMRKRLIK